MMTWIFLTYTSVSIVSIQMRDIGDFESNDNSIYQASAAYCDYIKMRCKLQFGDAYAQSVRIT